MVISLIKCPMKSLFIDEIHNEDLDEYGIEIYEPSDFSCAKEDLIEELGHTYM